MTQKKPLLQGIQTTGPGMGASKGPPGPAGSQGPVGPVGPQGPTGQTGPKGDQGDQGDQGIQGIPGVKGDQGDKGDKGDKGDIGLTGPPGPKGDKGDTGPVGPPGGGGVFFIPRNYHQIIQGSWAYNQLGAQWSGFYFENISNANNDEINYACYLSVGDYELTMQGRIHNTGGIMTIYDDITNIGQFNFWRTGTAYTNNVFFGPLQWTVSSNAHHHIRLVMNVGAGGDYMARYSDLSIIRVA